MIIFTDIICPSCGTYCPDDYNFCDNCGMCLWAERIKENPAEVIENIITINSNGICSGKGSDGWVIGAVINFYFKEEDIKWWKTTGMIINIYSNNHKVAFEIWNGKINKGDSSWWTKYKKVSCSDECPGSVDPWGYFYPSSKNMTLLIVHWPIYCGCNKENIKVKLVIGHGGV